MNILLLLRPKSTVAFIYEDNTIRQGLEKLRAHHYTAIPVVAKSGEYIGTVNEGDFLWHMADHDSYEMKAQEEYRVADILRADWNPAVRISATMDDLLLKVMDQNFVPVVDDRNLFMGIVTRRDVLKYFYMKDQERSLDKKMIDVTDQQLIEGAYRAMKHAYAPYSQYTVGAALVCDNGNVYTGCNIENASYGATICAERVAISKCIADGNRKIKKIAIVSQTKKPTPPCGICRQVLSEFMDEDGVIVLDGPDGIVNLTRADILPGAFGKKDLNKIE